MQDQPETILEIFRRAYTATSHNPTFRCSGSGQLCAFCAAREALAAVIVLLEKDE